MWYEQHGNLNVPSTLVNERGFPLGRWLRRHVPDENGKTVIQVTPERKKKLDAIGMVWERPADSWEVRYGLAKAYFEEHGNLNIPPQYKAEGIWISKWLNEQRQIYIGNRQGKQLTEDQIQRLEAIGMTWGNRNHQLWSQSWQKQYEEAKAFFQHHGNLSIPRDYMSDSGKKLGIWVRRQRTLYRDGKLPQEQLNLLTAIGMVWEIEDTWEIGFEHAQQYFQEHHNLNVPRGWVCSDGYCLSSWLHNQRNSFRNPSKYHYITQDQARRLEAIGIVWNPSGEQWMEAYRHAEEYLKLLDGKPWKTTYVSPDGFKTGQWIRGQIRAFHRGGMKKDKKEMFLKLGLVPVEQQKINASRERAIHREEARYDL